MAFKIEHENYSKNLKIDSTDGEGINDITFTKNMPRDSSNKIFEDEPLKEIDDHEDMGIDFITNEHKRNDPEPDDPEEEQPLYDIKSNNDSDDILMYNNDNIQDEPYMSHEEIQQEKAYYLSQLKRLSDKGYHSSRRLNYEHTLNEIKSEVLKIRKEIEINRGINYCRQGLMFCVNTIEMLNNKYDPFSVDLDGWSNIMMADKESYDDVFEELYEKYSTDMKIAPELKLISMVAGSALMFHLQKSLINKQFSNNSGGGGIFESLASKLGKMGSANTTNPPQEQKMKGPSINTDELLRKLNDDDFSDESSIMSEKIDDTISKTISIAQPKKRGRKPKKI